MILFKFILSQLSHHNQSNHPTVYLESDQSLSIFRENEFRDILSMITCQAVDHIANYCRSIPVKSGRVCVIHGLPDDPIQNVGLLYTVSRFNALQLHTWCSLYPLLWPVTSNKGYTSSM